MKLVAQKKIIFLYSAFLLLASFALPANAIEPVDEYKIKAGYLFNFTKFITWSDTNQATFNICILGHDPFGQLLEPIEQRTAFNRPIKLLRLNSSNKLSSCHIVYYSENSQLPNNPNVLSVGESPNFIKQGGMIAFIEKDNKIKLQINLKLLQQYGLKVSAKLLEVSEVVGDNND